MRNFTVNDLLEKKEIGTVLPLIVKVNEDDIPIFFIKDQRKTLEEIDENEIVAMKSTIIGDDKCFLLLMLFKFNNDFNTAYDVWFNFGYSWHAEFLQILKDNNNIIIDFRDEENERVKTIEIGNEIKETIKEYIGKAEETILFKGEEEEKVIYLVKDKRHNVWDEEDVDKMIDTIFEKYDNIEDLWNNI